MKWLFAVVATALLQRDRVQVSPIQKVVQMLNDMLAQGQSDLQAEQVSFAKFEQFCQDTTTQKTDSIATQTEQIESLQADVQEFTSKSQEHARAAAQLNKDLANQQADLKNLQAERAKEHKAFLAEHADFSESVDAVGRALSVLKNQNYDRKQSFLQTATSAAIPEKAKQLIQSYLALHDDGDDFLNRTGPEANAYEFQSDGIVGLLNRLLTDFKTKVHESEVAEMNGRHSFELASQDLNDAIVQSKAQFGEASKASQRARSNAAQSAKSLSATQAAKVEDVQFLNDLKVECSDKTHSFTEKQQLRQDELDALSKAVEILGQGAVQGAAAKRTFFLQQSKPWAVRVSKVLQAASEKFSDQRLALLAQHAQQDQFKKVKRLVREMIDRLLEEANAEAEKKGFCDKELKTNKQQREKLQGQYDTTIAEFEQATALHQKLNEEIAQLQEDLTLLDQQRATAVEQRKAQKTQNEATVKEAKEAQVAVAQARQVIADFYAEAGTATAFIQLHRPSMGSDEWNALANPNAESAAGYGQESEDKVDEGHKEGMQTFGSTYEGQQDSAGGVLGMLDVIASDFANLQADTESSEAQAEKEHDTFMRDTQRDKAVKSKQVEMNTVDTEAAKARAHSLKQDASATDDELRAANRYFEQLKPQCLVTFSYEDRVKKREEEIDSLKEALEILRSANPDEA
eukprot:GEMP01018242.1.p1 GENE.GEMP01018242.1~~GEMP01018242.1.p1  ORF type:complete len:687 (+),score=221.27 GEMP01018242.1:116-2176(+)